VTNRIAVETTQADPVQLRERIEEALERRAEREADRISIEVHDGVVKLQGRVRNWSEKRAILGTVGHAQGVRHVDDRLVVSPHTREEIAL
jgi:osmotically-inducible protein OsmY